MGAHAEPQLLSVEEYLERERSSAVRHEYLAGRLFAMAGTSDVHNTIALNVAAELRAQLRGGPCRVFISDMKLRIATADTFYYPDVFVTCDPADGERYFKERPRVIFEVLSPGTEATDRREKHLVYGQLESLRDYVLVSQDAQEVEHFRRQSANTPWDLRVHGPDAVVSLPSIGAELSVSEIYLGT